MVGGSQPRESRYYFMPLTFYDARTLQAYFKSLSDTQHHSYHFSAGLSRPSSLSKLLNVDLKRIIIFYILGMQCMLVYFITYKSIYSSEHICFMPYLYHVKFR